MAILKIAGLAKQINGWLDEPPKRVPAATAETLVVVVIAVLIALKLGLNH